MVAERHSDIYRLSMKMSLLFTLTSIEPYWNAHIRSILFYHIIFQLCLCLNNISILPFVAERHGDICRLSVKNVAAFESHHTHICVTPIESYWIAHIHTYIHTHTIHTPLYHMAILPLVAERQNTKLFGNVWTNHHAVDLFSNTHKANRCEFATNHPPDLTYTTHTIYNNKIKSSRFIFLGDCPRTCPRIKLSPLQIFADDVSFDVVPNSGPKSNLHYG